MRRTKPQMGDSHRTNWGQIKPNYSSDSMWQGQRLATWLITYGTGHTSSILTIRDVIRRDSALCLPDVFFTAQTEEELVDKLEKHQWYHKLKRQRELRGWSRAYVAEGLKVDIKTVSRWERGESFPQSRYRLDLIEFFKTSAVNLGLVEDDDPVSPSQVAGPVAQGTQAAQAAQAAQDWGEAPHINACYGRQEECNTLKHWILDEHCSVIAVLGIGGIGKTTVTTMLAQQMSNDFTYVIWRSLQNAPPVEQIIASCLQFAAEATGIDPTGQGNQPGDLNKLLMLLVTFLREHRCLIILDNVESIFETGQRAGRYITQHDGYGQFFQLLGEAEHQSCLLLTSREKPKEITRMEGKTSRVRTFALPGIKDDDGQQLLKERELFGSPDDWTALIHMYSGNPLALKLVAEPIQELFNGDIASFLAGNAFVLDNIHDLIAQQFQRLTPPEKEILYSLAVEREPASRSDLLENMHYAYPKNVVLLDALDSLRRRSLIEISEHEGRDKSYVDGDKPYVALQPVIREYVTAHFVEKITQEIVEAGLTPTRLDLLNMQPVLKALAKDYIRQSQEQQIIEPILQNLQKTLGPEKCIAHLKSMLASLHTLPQYKNGYAAGSLLNLLTHLGADLRGLDCSHLTIRQAYLQGFALPEINFHVSNLATTVFTDTFSSIQCVAVSHDGQMLAAGTTTNEVRFWRLDGLVPFLTSQQSNAQRQSSHARSNGQHQPLPTSSTTYPAVITQGHTDGIRAIAFDPHNRLLATGSEDQTIRLWDAGTGECLAVLSGHTNWVRSIAFSPDGSLLASCSEDQTVRLWNIETRTCCQILRGHTQRVRAVAFSPRGDLLASGGDDHTIRLWNTQTWECSHVLREHSSDVRTLAFHPTEMMLASGSEDKTICLWDTSTGTCLTTLRGHTHRISALTFARGATGVLLASSSDDLTIRLWDFGNGVSSHTLQGY